MNVLIKIKQKVLAKKKKKIEDLIVEIQELQKEIDIMIFKEAEEAKRIEKELKKKELEKEQKQRELEEKLAREEAERLQIAQRKEAERLEKFKLKELEEKNKQAKDWNYKAIKYMEEFQRKNSVFYYNGYICRLQDGLIKAPMLKDSKLIFDTNKDKLVTKDKQGYLITKLEIEKLNEMKFNLSKEEFIDLFIKHGEKDHCLYKRESSHSYKIAYNDYNYMIMYKTKSNKYYFVKIEGSEDEWRTLSFSFNNNMLCELIFIYNMITHLTDNK